MAELPAVFYGGAPGFGIFLPGDGTPSKLPPCDVRIALRHSLAGDPALDATFMAPFPTVVKGVRADADALVRRGGLRCEIYPGRMIHLTLRC